MKAFLNRKRLLLGGCFFAIGVCSAIFFPKLLTKKCKATWESCEYNTKFICFEIENSCKDGKYSLNMTGEINSPWVFQASLMDESIRRVKKFILIKNEKDPFSGYSCKRYVWHSESGFERSEIEESCELTEYQKIFEVTKTILSVPTLDKKHVEVSYEY